MFKDDVLSALIPRVLCPMASLCCARVEDATTWLTWLSPHFPVPSGVFRTNLRAVWLFPFLSVSYSQMSVLFKNISSFLD